MITRRGGFILLAALLLMALVRPGWAQSGPVYDPANGHWYQAVRVAGAITWDDARAAAQSLTYAGFPGHLVTFSSAAESDFVAGTVLAGFPTTDQWWLGGYQDTSAPDYVEPAGGWRWVTGEPWAYTNWYPGEPNNYGGNEDALNFNRATEWNDFPRGLGLGGYIVEYEPVPIATGPLLSFQPNPVVGGQPATGQLILAKPAGLGGAVVSLSSSNPAAAAVPQSITVPTDANTFSFPVVTFPIAAATTVTITATYPGGTGAGTLQVVPGTSPPPAPPSGTGAPGAPAPVFNPANGHWYQAVPVASGISWPQARDAASALSYAGYPGHLVTITSADENGFVDSYLPLPGTDEWWTGAYQDRSAPDYVEPAGGWRWITDEPWGFTFWGAGQPDNFQGDQDNMDIDTRFGDHWDDRYEADRVAGYIVEYEPAAVAPPPVAPPPVAPPPAGAAQMVLFPNPVPGGLLALGEVTLSQATGANGAPISLTSSNPAAAVVPAQVSVLPGASAVTFPVVTFAVSQPTPVTISAGGAFGPATATLTVLPLGAVSPPAPAAVNLLVNGSFEQPHGDLFGVGSGVPGWTILQGDIDILTSTYWQAAPDGGNQSIDLDGFNVGTIQQSFPTVPGQAYVFSGWVSHNPSVSYGRANVSLNGVFFTQLAHSIPDTNPNMQWQPFSYSFRATTATTTLTISDVTGINSSQGTVLDGLSVTLATGQNPPVPTPTAELPSPSNLTARFVPGAGVSLSWQDNSSDEDAFAVWRRTGSGDWTRIAVLVRNTTSFVDASVTAGATYTYRVRCNRGNVASAWSNEVSVTTPGQ